MSEAATPERDPEMRPPERSLFLFGRDVSKIPCFRNSILYGIYGGLGMGLGHFMFRSRPLAACNFAVYTFSGVTFAYWIHCRYNYSKQKFEMLRLQELLRRNALYEGTYRENELENSSERTNVIDANSKVA